MPVCAFTGSFQLLTCLICFWVFSLCEFCVKFDIYTNNIRVVFIHHFQLSFIDWQLTLLAPIALLRAPLVVMCSVFEGNDKFIS